MTLPDRIDGYVVKELVGSGGFGDVYRAHHAVLDRDVAIKILHGLHCRDPEAIERFVVEARAATAIDHPGIVDIHGFGELDDGRHYYVMELLRGRTLRAVIDDRGRISAAEALPIFDKLADAIDAAHAAGVVHRDLKPENLFIEPDGSVRVIDFGLAKLSADAGLSSTGEFRGSPRYMSPEQCRGRRVEAASDRYSFGAVLYHALVGAPPFEGDALALALHHLNDVPVPPRQRVPVMPAHLDTIVMALLAKSSKARPDRLRGVIDLWKSETAPRRSHSGRRSVVIAGSVLAVLGVGAFAIATRSPDQSARVDDIAPPSLTFTVARRIPLSGTTNADLTNTGELVIETANPTATSILTGVTRTVPDPAHAPLGRLADGRDVVHRAAGLLAVDSDHREQELITPIDSASVSPDGMHIAFVTNSELSTYDVATGLKRKLADIPPTDLEVIPQWSPSGASIVIVAHPAHQVRVVRVADGTTRVVDLPTLRETGTAVPAALLDDDRLVYCNPLGRSGRKDGYHPTLRIRSISSPRDDVVIQDLDSWVSGCNTFVHDRTIAVELVYGRNELGVLPLGDVEPHLNPVVANHSMWADAVDPQGEHVYAFEPGDKPVEVRLGDHAITPQPPCRNAVWYEGPSTIEYAVATLGELARYDIHCKPIGVWRVPKARFGRPQCRQTACAVVGTVGDSLVAWRLVPGGEMRELGRTPRSHPEEITSIAVSPDGSHVAAVVDLATICLFGPTPPRLFAVATGNVQTVAWGEDSSHFVATGVYVDGPGYSVLDVDLDGKRTLRWHDDTTWFIAAGMLPDNRLFGTMKRIRNELLVLERAR